MNALSVGFPGREKSSVTTALIRPQVQVARHKLSALVDSDRCRQSHLSPDPVQHLDDICAAEGEARLQRRRKARERVDERYRAKDGLRSSQPAQSTAWLSR